MKRIFATIVLALFTALAHAQFPAPVGFFKTQAGGDPSFANVSLLVANNSGANGTGTFTDQSANGYTVTNTGSVVWSNTSPPTGLTTWASFNGGNKLSIASTANLTLRTSFTIEGYVNLNGSGSALIVGKDGGAGLKAWNILFRGGSEVSFSASDDGTNNFISIATGELSPSWATGTQYYFAVTFDGSNYRGYFGASSPGATVNRVFNLADSTLVFDNSSTPVTLGSRDDGVFAADAQVGPIRITRGTARYTGATMTAPSLALPTN